MARTVVGVFRSQAQAERALQELKARGLDRDVSLAPHRPAAGAGSLPGWLGLQGEALASGPAPDPGPEDWSRAPFQMAVTTSARQAPEVAQLLRQFGAEEVDVS